MSNGRLTLPVGEGDHISGAHGATVTLLEYGDYQCPYCGAAYPIVKRVQERLGKKLRFVFRNFPLSEIHPYALHAAEAAEAVAEHGGEKAFWAMHDLLFEHQRDLSDAALIKLATQAGVEAGLVRGDLEEDRFEERVRDHFMSGVKSGVNGTPTFFINGKRHDASWDEDSLVMALEAASR